jgi:hypothetical protein
VDLFFSYSLGQPWALLLIPLSMTLLIWLDRRRKKPRRLLVASRRLFPDFAPAKQQRVKSSWSIDLWLYLLIAIFSGIVVAAPQKEIQKVQSIPHVFVIEHGWTMAAGDRWSRTKNLVHEALGNLDSQESVHIFLSPNHGNSPWRGSVGTATAFLEQINVSSKSSELEPSALTALSQTGESPILVFTDHEPHFDPWLKKRVHVFADADREGNVSLLACGAKRLGAKQDQIQVTLANSGDKAVSVSLGYVTSNKDGEEKKSRTLKVTLMAGERKVLSDQVSRTTTFCSWSILKVDSGDNQSRPGADALKIDNTMRLARGSPRPLPVRLSGPNSKELVRVLSSIPGIELSEGSPIEGQLSVVTGEIPDPLTNPCILVLPPEKNVQGLPALKGSRWLEQGEIHFEIPAIASARSQIPGPLGTMKPLLLSQEGVPLIARRGQGLSQILYMGFALTPDVTNWVRQRSFPMFFVQVVESLGKASGELQSLPLGQPFPSLEEFRGAGNMVKIRHVRSTQEWTLSAADTFTPQRPGLYTVKSKDKAAHSFAVNGDFTAGYGLPAFKRPLDFSVLGTTQKRVESRETSAENWPAFLALLCVIILILRRLKP